MKNHVDVFGHMWSPPRKLKAILNIWLAIVDHENGAYLILNYKKSKYVLKILKLGMVP